MPWSPNRKFRKNSITWLWLFPHSQPVQQKWAFYPVFNNSPVGEPIMRCCSLWFRFFRVDSFEFICHKMLCMQFFGGCDVTDLETTANKYCWKQKSCYWDSPLQDLPPTSLQINNNTIMKWFILYIEIWTYCVHLLKSPSHLCFYICMFKVVIHTFNCSNYCSVLPFII